MIGIINYGMGNLRSVQNALDFIGVESRIFDDPALMESFSKLILPGVGAFGAAMRNLNTRGFTTAIKQEADKGKPFLGICLGMQLLLNSSTEHGLHQGLGLVDGVVLFLGEKTTGLAIPHMGWNDIYATRSSVILKDVPAEENIYYFVHSYYCRLNNTCDRTATANYGFDFDVVLQSNNIFGCQFHPEKSQRSGLIILKNFASL